MGAMMALTLQKRMAVCPKESALVPAGPKRKSRNPKDSLMNKETLRILVMMIC
jgi:hypothetical protein